MEKKDAIIYTMDHLLPKLGEKGAGTVEVLELP